VGVALAVFCYLVDLPILAIALGIYLPLGLTSAIFAGCIIRSLVERKAKQQGDEEAVAVDKGVLLASGLVAGGALMGIVVGMFAALGVNIALGLKLFPAVSKSNLLALVMFLLLGAWMYWYSLRKARTE
jgi:preprotein translocase subunit YajC